MAALRLLGRHSHLCVKCFISLPIAKADPSSVTFPVAYFFDKYPWRREPLVVAVLVLEGALVLFMLATPFWVMVIARFLMGAASKVVWSGEFSLIFPRAR